MNDEIRRSALRPCEKCGGPLGITFFKVEIGRFAVDCGAAQRSAGMEMMMGGHTVIANVLMGDPVIAKRYDETSRILCGECAALTIGDLMEGRE